MAQANWRQQTLAPGFWVALTLSPEAALLRVYVGQVQAVDAHGVRLTLVDWILGAATHWDFYAPWGQITSALIATPEHAREGFADAAADWQDRMPQPPMVRGAGE
jgi:hypothetical protein